MAKKDEIELEDTVEDQNEVQNILVEEPDAADNVISY